MKVVAFVVCLLACIIFIDAASYFRERRSPQFSGSSASASAQSGSGAGFGRGNSLTSSSANAETSSFSGGNGGRGSGSSSSANANSETYNSGGLRPRQPIGIGYGQQPRAYNGGPVMVGGYGGGPGFVGRPVNFGRAPVGFGNNPTGSLAKSNAVSETVG